MKGIPVTQPEAVLLAALQLDQDHRTISLASLAVKAWENDQQTFGLSPGYVTAHPDVCKAKCCLCGYKGLVGKELLAHERFGSNYTLTDKGRKMALALAGEAVGVPFDLPPAYAVQVARCLTTEAWRRRKDTTSLHFNEAQAFFGVKPGEEGIAAQVDRVGAAIQYAATHGHPEGPALFELFRYLECRFEKQLAWLMGRRTA